MARRNDSGQALVESAIVLPLMLFVFLSLLQLMLLAHGRVMLEYAAFNACRAGVVHNGDRGTMRNAALISLLPVYGPTNTLESFAATYGKVKLWALVGEVGDGLERGLGVMVRDLFGVSMPHLPPIGVVDVWATNPTYDDFHGAEEIDLDLPTLNSNVAPQDALQRTRLTTITTWLFELKVPFANRLVFYSWFLWHYLHLKLTGGWLDPRTVGNMTVEEMARTAPFATNLTNGNAGGVIAGVIEQQAYFQALRWLADMDPPHFFMPIDASYSMPIESNLFRRNFE